MRFFFKDKQTFVIQVSTKDQVIRQQLQTSLSRQQTTTKKQSKPLKQDNLLFSFLLSLPNQTSLYSELLIVLKISQIQSAYGHQCSLQTGVQHFWLWYTEFLFNTLASLKKRGSGEETAAEVRQKLSALLVSECVPLPWSLLKENKAIKMK